MPVGYIGLVSALLQGDGYDRLGAVGAFGQPGELNQVGALHLGEAAVVGPDAAFVLDREVVQTIDCWIEDDALGAVPRSAGAFGVDPDIVDLFGGRGNGAIYGDISEVHRQLSFFFSTFLFFFFGLFV